MQSRESLPFPRTWVVSLAAALTLSVAAGADGPSAKDKAPAPKDQGEIKIEQTDYAGFFKAMEKFKGHVVLVDVWGEF